MDFLANLQLGFSIAFTPFNLIMAAAGVTVGTLIGALPGIGPVSGVALLLPLTFGMEPVSGIIMLASLYAGSMYGGTITSVLINTPGESASVVTCIDGYQMALQGRAGPALGVAAIGSFVAGTVGVVLLMLMSPLLARWALSFGPPETFALMLLGLTTVTGLTGDNALKGYISMVFGLMLAMVGFDIISGDARYAFGFNELLDGVEFLPVAIGLFGLGEVLVGAEQAADMRILRARFGIRDVMLTATDWARSRAAIARGTVIGFLIGVLPGAGPTIASFLAYTLEKKVSKHPEEFGHGAIEGVAAPESANNAATGSAFIPLMTLGVPPNVVMAMLMGAFMIHGVQPGPLLMTQNPGLFWGVIASMYLGNVMLLILNLPLIGLWVQVLRVPYRILFPLILLFCLIGVYSVSNSIFDIYVMIGFGAVGYLMKKFDYEGAPLVLAFVLGPLLENNLRKSLILSQGDFAIFVTRPLSATCLALAVLLLVSPFLPALAQRRRAVAVEEVS
jgi:putative tricarboxylic transport membrane protein